jgi:cytochrome c-type biogenesis protein CcsB
MVLIGFFCYILHVVLRHDQFGTSASILLILSWVLLLITLAVRGVASGHWPLGSQYEFTLCFVWIVLTIYLLMEAYWQDRRSGAFVSIILLLLLLRAITMSSQARAIGPLPPVLRSFWLQVHVLTVMVGYGAFGVATGLSLASLFAKPIASMPNSEIPSRLPNEQKIRQMMLRLLALGFPWLTLGILTGAVWAHYAWGRYWGWDPKETWALITWIWYLMLFHLYSIRSWRGKRFSLLVLIGFGLVMFTFIGVPYLASVLQLDTLHGY